MKSTIWLMAAMLIVVSGTCSAASFNCANANTPMEQTVCADPELSNLDSELSKAYKAARVGSPQVVHDQKVWLASAMKCVDADCLRNAYQTRLEQLRAGLGSEGQSAVVEGATNPTSEPGTTSQRVSRQSASGSRTKATPDQNNSFDLERYYHEKGVIGQSVFWVIFALALTALGVLFKKFMRLLWRILGSGEFATALIGDWGPNREETLYRERMLKAIRERK
jgi:uncharacterized protein